MRIVIFWGLFQNLVDEGGDVGNIDVAVGVDVAHFGGEGGGAEYVVDEGGDVGHVNWHRSR